MNKESEWIWKETAVVFSSTIQICLVIVSAVQGCYPA